MGFRFNMKPIFFLSIICITLIFFTGCTQQTTVKHAEFLSYPDEIRNCDYRDFDKSFNILIQKEGNLLVDYSNPIMEFEIVPLPEDMSDKDDYAYLFFECSGFDKRIFRDSHGIYQLIWTDEDDTIFLESGQRRTNMIDKITLQLELKLNPFQLIDLERSEFEINFWNYDNSWRETYTVNLIGIEL